MSYASWSSSLPVPLLGPRGRKRARTPARSIRLGRVHRAGGVTPVEARHQPHSQNQQHRASWRRSRVDGIREKGREFWPQGQLTFDFTPIAGVYVNQTSKICPVSSAGIGIG